MSHFDDLELLLAKLLTNCALSADEQGEVQHYIDVGEYGLALETAVAIYAEEKKNASPVVRDLIEQLAVAMEMDSVELLGRLPNRLT